MPTTTLIVPAYNEGDRLATGFARLQRAADEGRIDFDDLRLLYVDDGSTDDTAAVAASLVAGLPHGEVLVQGANRGKGAAVRAGVTATTTERLVFTDADMAIDPRQIPTLLAALAQAPIAVGSRTVQGHIDYGSWLRTRAGRTFNRIVRSVSSVELRDTQCGFKAMSTPHAKVLFSLTGIDGFAFDVEVLSRARLLDWAVAEVPVSWSDVGGSHVRLAADSVTMLRDLLAARLRSSDLATIPGVGGIAVESRPSLAAIVRDTALEASPVLLAADGSLCLLAPLVNDPGPMLAKVADELGGARRDISVADLSAGTVTSATA